MTSDGKTREYKTTEEGHTEEIKAFVNALHSVEDPSIEWRDLRSVTLTSISEV